MIRVKITDREALGRISPEMLRSYLETRGWDQGETWRGVITIWTKTEGGQTGKILMPLSQRSDAYEVRISEAVELLAGMEDRSQLDVYHELLAAGPQAGG